MATAHARTPASYTHIRPASKHGLPRNRLLLGDRGAVPGLLRDRGIVPVRLRECRVRPSLSLAERINRSK